jgi:hypothetical protein
MFLNLPILEHLAAVPFWGGDGIGGMEHPFFDILCPGLTERRASCTKEAPGAKESECERCDNFAGFQVFRSGRRGHSVYLLSDRNL